MSTEALERIAARLDALERKIDAMGHNGGSGSALSASTLEGRLAARIDRIETLVDTFGTFAERLPVVADAAATGASWAWSQAEQRGVDPIATGQRAAALGLTLAHPDNLALAERLLASKANLVLALDALDAIDPADVEIVVKQGSSLTKTLAAVLRAPELARLLQAGADPGALGTAEAATTALVETRKQPVEPVGLFGALKKMGDPDVQRAVGFTLALAKRFGQLLGR
jgi:hypothetical protein